MKVGKIFQTERHAYDGTTTETKDLYNTLYMIHLEQTVKSMHYAEESHYPIIKCVFPTANRTNDLRLTLSRTQVK